MMLLLITMMIMMVMVVGFDDADHFAACLHPLLSALVMLTSKVQLIHQSFTTSAGLQS